MKFFKTFAPSFVSFSLSFSLSLLSFLFLFSSSLFSLFSGITCTSRYDAFFALQIPIRLFVLSSLVFLRSFDLLTVTNSNYPVQTNLFIVRQGYNDKKKPAQKGKKRTKKTHYLGVKRLPITFEKIIGNITTHKAIKAIRQQQVIILPVQRSPRISCKKTTLSLPLHTQPKLTHNIHTPLCCVLVYD